MQNIEHEEKLEALNEALELLGQAEELIRSVEDSHLNAYAADQINAQERVLGKQVFQVVQEAIQDLENSVCPKCGSANVDRVQRNAFGCMDCEHEWNVPEVGIRL